MKQEKISDALELLPEEMLEQAQSERVKKKKKQRWLKWVAAAACFCLVAVGAWDTLERMDFHFFQAACGSFPGQFVGENYYYYVPGEGVLRYTPGGESELALHTYWFEEWEVNEYGIYYWWDMSVYVKDHETGTRTKLYTASRQDTTHIRFVLPGDGNVVVTHYNKDTDIVYEVMIDGKTGELLETVMEPTPNDVSKHTYWSRLNFFVGDRHIELVPVNEHKTRCLLTENGQNLLSEGMFVGPIHTPSYHDGAHWLRIGTLDGYESAEYQQSAVVYPDGRTEVVTLPVENYYGGTAEYKFAVKDGEVLCAEVSTGDSWILERDAETENLHDLATNGIHLYTMAPWAEEQMCWELVYDDNGRPVGLTQIAESIHVHEN